MARPSTRKGFIAALIAGTLIVPGVAIALTNGLTDGAVNQDQPTTTMAFVASPTTTGGVLATTTTMADDNSADDLSAEDLALACGEEGLALVASEASGAITDIEAAALTALREICEEEGSPLPAAAAPEITEVVVVQAAPPAPAAATSGTNGDYDDDYDDHNDDHYDDHDEDDDEDEDDEDDQDHHEDHDDDHHDDHEDQD